MSVGLAVAASYVLGSIPFALIAGRMKGIDIRAHGSGNLGATNAIRVLGAGLGVPVLLADIAKGLLSVAVFPGLFGATEPWLPLACGGAAILGHMFSVFLRFGGGKGVATAGGAFLGLAPAALGLAAVVFAGILFSTRYMSLASMLGAVTLPIALWTTCAPQRTLVAGIVIAVLVVFRHRSNVARLVSGTENRVSFGRKGGRR